jgi:ATP phosphoribosyltransferase
VNQIKYFAALVLLTLPLMGCTSMLKPQTITEAIVHHQTFPNLMLNISQCAAQNIVAHDAIVDPYNVLFDKYEVVSKWNPEAILIEVVGAKQAMFHSERAWNKMWKVLDAADIDCGETVQKQRESISKTFTEIKTVMLSNQRIVYVFEWGSVIAGLVSGSKNSAERMERLIST